MENRFYKLIKKIVPPKWYSIIDNEGYKRYFFNTGWMFGGKIFSLGISFIIGIYIARYLGPSNYGLFSYVISFVGLFGFLASFGLDSIVSREIIKNHDDKDKIIGTAFYLKIVGSIVAIFSVVIVSVFFVKDIFTLGLVWMFSLSFIPQAFNVIELYFQSQVSSKKVILAQIIANVISTILKILCILLGKGIFWLSIIYIIETTIYALILIFSYKKFGEYIKKWKFDFKIAKDLLIDSWPLMLATVSIAVYMKIDQVMIKNILGNEQAGIYTVAINLAEVWYIIPVLICKSLYPAIVSSLGVSKEFFQNRMKKLYFFMFWLSFLIAIFMTILSSPIIKIFFGLPYLGAVTVLQIYTWAGLSAFLGIVNSQYLLATNMTRILFYNALLGAVINVILNIVLIPKIGINGAAVATLISYTVVTFGVIIFRKTRSQGILMLRSIINYS